MKKCLVSSCKNKVAHGRMCSTHRYRFNKYNSYDLPSHDGEKSFLDWEPLPDGIVLQCNIHGNLEIKDTYQRLYKGNPNYSCKPCYLVRRLKKFSMTEKDYNYLLKEQNYRCKICLSEKNLMSCNKITLKSLCIDHCHKTGKVRGLLCDKCNQALGAFKDSPELLQSAIDYLKKSTGDNP